MTVKRSSLIPQDINHFTKEFGSRYCNISFNNNIGNNSSSQSRNYYEKGHFVFTPVQGKLLIP